ncbi:MAG: hypothetical protein AAB217_18675 [Chloroflexota bacterium]
MNRLFLLIMALLVITLAVVSIGSTGASVTASGATAMSQANLAAAQNLTLLALCFGGLFGGAMLLAGIGIGYVAHAARQWQARIQRASSPAPVLRRPLSARQMLPPPAPPVASAGDEPMVDDDDWEEDELPVGREWGW